jgi:hypothetical protein
MNKLKEAVLNIFRRVSNYIFNISNKENRLIDLEEAAEIFYNKYIELSPGNKESPAWSKVSKESKEHLINSIDYLLHTLYDDVDIKDIEFDKEDTENIISEDEHLLSELLPVKDFFDEYIGVIITGYDVFADDLEDLELKICPSIISSVNIDNENIYIELININGTNKGCLKITPTRKGEFAQRGSNDKEIWASRYRINLYGGESIEYLDSDHKGIALFIEDQGDNI